MHYGSSETDCKEDDSAEEACGSKDRSAEAGS
jgi:hypothetical protein